MRIALFTDRFFPHIDGISIYVYELSQMLSAKGHRVLLYAPKPQKRRDELPSQSELQIRYVPSIPLPNSDSRMVFPFSIQLMAELKDFHVDVCHFHTPFMIGFQGVIAAKLLNIPLVATFHTYFMEPEYLKRMGLDRIKLDNNEFINKAVWNYAVFFYNRADVVISPSDFTKKDLENNNIKVPVEVVHNAIITQKKDNSIKKKFSLPKKYILYTGRLSKEKSVDQLIHSFRLISEKITDIHLVLVGDGPEKSKLEKLVKNMQLSNRVHFVGMVDHETLINSNMYTDALVFVTASSSEIQPISILEAMAHGLPIVGANARGVTELIEGNGIICKPDDIQDFAQAVLFLLTNKEERFKCVRQNKHLLKKYSFDTSIKQLERIYTKLSRKEKKNGIGPFNPKLFLEEMFKTIEI